MMENYSALRNKEILSHAITWINPKDIMLSSQSDETICSVRENVNYYAINVNISWMERQKMMKINSLNKLRLSPWKIIHKNIILEQTFKSESRITY